MAKQEKINKYINHAIKNKGLAHLPEIWLDKLEKQLMNKRNPIKEDAYKLLTILQNHLIQGAISTNRTNYSQKWKDEIFHRMDEVSDYSEKKAYEIHTEMKKILKLQIETQLNNFSKISLAPPIYSEEWKDSLLKWMQKEEVVFKYLSVKASNDKMFEEILVKKAISYLNREFSNINEEQIEDICSIARKKFLDYFDERKNSAVHHKEWQLYKSLVKSTAIDQFNKENPKIPNEFKRDEETGDIILDKKGKQIRIRVQKVPLPIDNLNQPETDEGLEMGEFEEKIDINIKSNLEQESFDKKGSKINYIIDHVNFYENRDLLKHFYILGVLKLPKKNVVEEKFQRILSKQLHPLINNEGDLLSVTKYFLNKIKIFVASK